MAGQHFIRVGVLGLLSAGLSGSPAIAGPAPILGISTCSFSPTSLSVDEGETPIATATATGTPSSPDAYPAFSTVTIGTGPESVRSETTFTAGVDIQVGPTWVAVVADTRYEIKYYATISGPEICSIVINYGPDSGGNGGGGDNGGGEDGAGNNWDIDLDRYLERAAEALPDTL